MYRFWDMQISRAVLLLYFLVMTSGLMLYTDFHYQADGVPHYTPNPCLSLAFLNRS